MSRKERERLTIMTGVKREELTRAQAAKWMAVACQQSKRSSGVIRPIGILVVAQLRRSGTGVSNSLAGRRQSCILPAGTSVIRLAP